MESKLLVPISALKKAYQDKYGKTFTIDELEYGEVDILPVLSFSSDEVPYCCGVIELGDFSISRDAKRFSKELNLLSVLSALLGLNFFSIIQEPKKRAKITYPYSILFTVIEGKPDQEMVCDLLTSLLPFRLIAKGKNDNSNKLLRTYILNPNVE